MTIHNGGHRGVVDFVNRLGLVVLFPNCVDYSSVVGLNAGEDALLDYVMSGAAGTTHDNNRSGPSDGQGTNKRIRWGINQIQQVGRCDNRQYSAAAGVITVGGKHVIGADTCCTSLFKRF